MRPAAESPLRAGHPWLFADSIREQNRPGEPGELAVIYDRRNQFLALGLFDPDSPLRVRVLQAGQPAQIDAAWWAARLERAIGIRANLFDGQTTGYRWIHGENDGWPGLVLDRYAETLVLKLYTQAWFPRLAEITKLLVARLQPGRIVLRLSRNIQAAARAWRLADGQMLHGAAPESDVVFLEDGLRFGAEVRCGQKTGFFLDQRENRRRVGGLAAGRRLLNVFSFSGGFSLHAARAGAASVADLDLSAHALASARRNFALNRDDSRVAACPRQDLKADAFAWLGARPARVFDLIVLDPPSLARRAADKPAALQAYASLARRAAPHLSPGGLLVACSCSAHVPAAEFFQTVQGALAGVRRLERLQTTGHPPDHPATFAEAQYLKAIYLLCFPR